MNENKEIWEKYFKTTGRLTYLVENLEKCREQTGKTVIQKLMFLLARALKEDFDFRFHYYGPYSSYIDNELNNASFLQLVAIKWDDNRGYFISASEKASAFTENLSDEEKTEIEKLTEKYGELSANDLSIISTAYYLMEHYNLSGEKIIQEVGRLKSYDEKRIQELLEEYGIFEEKLTIDD